MFNHSFSFISLSPLINNIQRISTNLFRDLDRIERIYRSGVPNGRISHRVVDNCTNIMHI